MITDMTPRVEASASLVRELTATTFAEAIAEASTPVAVELWTEWCGPCRTFAPIVEQVASDLAGRFAFGKLDADAFPDVARRFTVMSFPTLLVFDQGELVHRLIGARGRRHLLEELSRWT